MVNTGKPSPGCFACRTRRIKCDTTRPECRKCRKRGWKCPGYRDLNALRIVDETQKQFTRFSGDKEKDQQDGPPEAAGSSSGTAVPFGPAPRLRPYEPPQRVVKVERTPPKHKPKPTNTTTTTTTARPATAYPSPVSHSASSPPNALIPAIRSPLPPQDPNQYHYQYVDGIPRCVGPHIGEAIYNYFVRNFVQGSSLRNHGYLDFLFPLLANQNRAAASQPESPTQTSMNPLPLAFSAAAMISFAARQKVPELVPRAETVYLRALEATFLAIRDPHRARDNSTLASVTLLTTFEVICRPKKDVPEVMSMDASRTDNGSCVQQLRPARPSPNYGNDVAAFGSHLDGAVALLKMRGKELFGTVVGCNIFTILRSLLVSRSLCYGAPLDPELYKLTDEFPQESYQHRFAELSLRAAELRVKVESLLGGWGPTHPSTTVPTRERIEALQQAADSLEADYDAHVRGLPLTWKAMTMRYVAPSDRPILSDIPFVGRVDAYADQFIAYILNWARAARMYMRYTSLRCHAWLLGPERDYRTTPEYAAAAALCQSIIEDIVASVPYVFGTATINASQTPGQVHQPPSLSGMFCMWPVFASATSDFATDSQRVFMKKTLKYIAEEIGIGQAAILAEYNMRSPSMPIAFARMKQFEAQGKQLQGVAAGSAAGSVLTSGLKHVMRTTGTVITTPPNQTPKKLTAISSLIKTEPPDDYNQDEYLPMRFAFHTTRPT